MFNKILSKLIEKILNFMERNSLIDEEINEIKKTIKKSKI